MRLHRVLAAATVFAALLSQPLAAQEGRPFKDAWFWGIKGGAMRYSSATANGAVAPFVGADWVITRTRGGVYVSFDQAFLSTQGTFTDRNTSNEQFNQVVDLTNMRRVSVAGMIFPMQRPTLHPYFGAGFAVHQLNSATIPAGGPSSRFPGAAQDSLQRKRTSLAPIFIGGVQARLSRFSVFGQAAAAPLETSFILAPSGGSSFGLSLEGGIRYNIGTSIDRRTR